ncbi:hypothetical protein E2C01_002768 [Portunus trituberculatus]|uniref:WW domain-binding protein 2 n=1 Tax=Portunus trituberculatus TaxID=210409 RepID=A0A5B7CL63_PORTR|nr:hypothetical protein [Portunus trituberculatus]
MEFGGSLPPEMRGSKTGRLYLTSHRFIFNNKDHKDRLQSFAAPFFSLEQVSAGCSLRLFSLADGVYMYDAPPPYPGLGFQNGTPAATGFSAADAKAQEAAQSAYYDPSNPQYAYVPPPAYSESPPSYDAATKKSQ